MIEKLALVFGDGYDPFHNLAVEEALMFGCVPKECVLYLWQNRRTVVIGRNQNADRECNLDALEKDGGLLARRNSGGGSVYHDLGNLNFSFLAREDAYDVSRQTRVIRNAIEGLGVASQASGRNDMLTGGKKFSGHAYYESGGFCCHHGTLMLDVDIHALARYLKAPGKRDGARAVYSVGSRVGNLKEYLPNLTLKRLTDALVAAFQEEYALACETVPTDALDAYDLKKREARFAAPAWRFGRIFKPQTELSKRFDWGEICLRTDGHETAIYSDALQTGMLLEWAERVKDAPQTARALRQALALCDAGGEKQRRMKEDIMSWLGDMDW